MLQRIHSMVCDLSVSHPETCDPDDTKTEWVSDIQDHLQGGNTLEVKYLGILISL